MSIDDYACVGDTIETDIQNPYPHKLYVNLATAEACALGNELIQNGRWKKTPPEVASTLVFPEEVKA